MDAVIGPATGRRTAARHRRAPDGGDRWSVHEGGQERSDRITGGLSRSLRNEHDLHGGRLRHGPRLYALRGMGVRSVAQ